MTRAPREQPPENPPAFEPLEIARTERLYDSKWCGLRRDWLVLMNRLLGNDTSGDEIPVVAAV